VYEIYAYWNAAQIEAILNAVVSVIGSGALTNDFSTLIRLMAILGFLITTVGALLKVRGEEPFKHMLMVGVLFTALLVPRTTVTITDLGVGAGAPRTVANVPVGLAFFASATSKIGHFFTDKFETFFSMPDPTMNFSQSGFMGSSRALRTSQGMSVTNNLLKMDIREFFRDCLYPELAIAGNYNALATSKDVWADILGLGLVNPGRNFMYHTGKAVIPCNTGYGNITAALNAEAAAKKTLLGQILWPTAPVAASSAAADALLPAAEMLMVGASVSATERIRQGMVINLLEDSNQDMATAVNDPSSVLAAYGKSAAVQSANTAYVVMGDLARETLPIIRNAAELLIYAVFPIVILMVIVAGHVGTVVLRHYVMTMVWVQLWAPLFAVANYIISLNTNIKVKASANGINGLAIDNVASMGEAMISSEAVAGMLAIAIPMIAMALVKGGEVAMSSLASTLTGPANSAGQSHGGSAGVGNISAGQVSWSTATLHQHNSAPSVVTGAGAQSRRDEHGGVITRYPKGSTYDAPLNNLGFSATDAAGLSKQFSVRGGEAVTAAKEKSEQFGASMMAAVNEQADRVRNKVQQWTGNSRLGRTNDTSKGFSAQDEQQLGRILGHDSATGQMTQTNSGATGNLSGSFGRDGGGWGAALGGNLTLATSLAAKHSDQIANRDQAGASETARQLHDVVSRLQKAEDYVNSRTGGVSESSGVSASLNAAKTANASALSKLGEARAFERSASVASDLSSRGQVDYARMLDADTAKRLDRDFRSNDPVRQMQALDELKAIAQATGPVDPSNKTQPSNFSDLPASGGDVHNANDAFRREIRNDGVPSLDASTDASLRGQHAQDKASNGLSDLTRTAVQKFGSNGAAALQGAYDNALRLAEGEYGAASDRFKERKSVLDNAYSKAIEKGTPALALDQFLSSASNDGKATGTFMPHGGNMHKPSAGQEKPPAEPPSAPVELAPSP
jgi:hypothetical protein